MSICKCGYSCNSPIRVVLYKHASDVHETTREVNVKDADKKIVKYKLKEIERQTALEELRRAAWRLAVPFFMMTVLTSFMLGIVVNDVKVTVWPITSYVMLVIVGLLLLWMVVRLGIFIHVKDKTYEVLKRDKYTNR